MRARRSFFKGIQRAGDGGGALLHPALTSVSPGSGGELLAYRNVVTALPRTLKLPTYNGIHSAFQEPFQDFHNVNFRRDLSSCSPSRCPEVSIRNAQICWCGGRRVRGNRPDSGWKFSSFRLNGSVVRRWWCDHHLIWVFPSHGAASI